MGVRSETYLLWGWSLPYSAFSELDDDAQEAIYDMPGGRKPEPGSVARLIDGMGGNYVAVGMVIERATDEGEGFYRPIDFSKLKPREADLPAITEAVAPFDCETGEPSFILLTHYH